MAGKCPSEAGLTTDRHNITLKLLISEVELLNGGRLHVLTTDAGNNKPVADFSSPDRDTLISDLKDRIQHTVPHVNKTNRATDAHEAVRIIGFD